MAEYKKLLLTGAKALKLDDELAMLEAVRAAVKEWSALKARLSEIALRDFPSLEALLLEAAAFLDSANVKAAFEAAGLKSAYAGLVAFAAKVKAQLGDVPQVLKDLLTAVDSFPEGTAGDLSWKIAVSDKPVIKTDQYGLNLGASAAVGLDPAVRWPDDPADGPLLLKVHAGGELKANAKGALPFAGKAEVGVDASLKAEIDYYFRRSPGVLYVSAVADGLAQVPDPFDFDSVWKAFNTPALEGVTYLFDGKAGANLQVRITDAIPLSAGIVADIGATVAVAATIGQSYQLKLRRKAAGAAAFRAELSRQRHTEATLTAELKVEADLGAITGPVIAAFKTAVEKWDAAIRQITPFLSPGTLLRAKLADQLEALVGEDLFRNAVLSDINGALGLRDDDESAVVDWLTNKVTEAIDKSSVLAGSQGSAAIDRLWSELGKTLPAVTRLVDGDPAADLKARLEARLKEVEEDLKKAAKDQLDQFGGAALKAAIEKAGAVVNGAVNTADDAFKAVRELLTYYDKVIHDTFKAAKAAAEKKATARIFREETRSTGLEVEVTGDFSAHSPIVSKVFEAMTHGSLQRLVQMIDDDNQPDGFELIRDKSSITRFSKTKVKDGLEIVFLGISLSAITEGATSVKIKTDGNGDVHVNTSAELTKRFSIQKRVREVSFAQTHALVQARATRGTPDAGTPTFDVGIGARFEDKSLTWGQVEAFIGALRQAGLAPGNVEASARSAFNGWAGTSGKIDGDVSVALHLVGDAIERFLLTGKRGADNKLTDAGKLEVIRAGLAALEKRGKVNDALFVPGAGVARQQFLIDPGDISVVELILRHRQGILTTESAAGTRPPDAEKPDAQNVVGVLGASKPRYVEFLRQGYVLMNLVDLVDVMGQTYLAAPAGVGQSSGWTQAQYDAAQATMVASARAWLTMVDSVTSFFQSDPSDRTMAFLMATARLAGLAPAATGGVVLTMTNRPVGKPEQTVSFGKAIGAG